MRGERKAGERHRGNDSEERDDVEFGRLGITQPAPQQIQASLTGGNVTNAAGQSVPIAGVLQQRNRGLTFPQIAQSIAGTATPAPAQAGTSGRVPAPTEAAANAAARAQGARADAFTSGTTTSSTTAGGATAPGTTSSFSSSGNAGTQGGSSTFSSSGTTQAGTGPRGNPAATGGGGLR